MNLRVLFENKLESCYKSALAQQSISDEDIEAMAEKECSHDWVEYKQCCYCGAFENGAGKVIQQRTAYSIEKLRTDFNEWYFGIKNESGKPPLAMQIFYWFEQRISVK